MEKEEYLFYEDDTDQEFLGRMTPLERAKWEQESKIFHEKIKEDIKAGKYDDILNMM